MVSEIPYQVQKGKLIEQIAQLIADKKLPILEDIRDESDELIRIVLVPKSRNVDPDDLKNALFRVENKTYGVCKVTGKLISKERLRVVPHATMSIEAKNAQK